jgi:sulfite reductase beta subunit-like hemoprotein
VSERLGEEKFREELPTQMSERMGAEHYGEERVETAEALGWIAERLAMGTRGYLNHLLYRRRKLTGE